MEDIGLFDQLPIWLMLLGTVVLVFLSVELGFRLARLRKQRSEEENAAPVGGIVGATLGLLAFMLAFTFGLAASRFDDRRKVVLEEANAIGTTYLRAAMLPEPLRTESRDLLRAYVDVRLEAAQPGNVNEAISTSEQLHDGDLLQDVLDIRRIGHAPTDEIAQPESLFRDDLGYLTVLIGHRSDA